MKKQYYYNLGNDKLLVIFNSNGNSIAHISDVDDDEDVYFLVTDTLYNIGIINETEDINLTRI